MECMVNENQEWIGGEVWCGGQVHVYASQTYECTGKGVSGLSMVVVVVVVMAVVVWVVGGDERGGEGGSVVCRL